MKFTSNTPGTYTIPALTKTSGTGSYTVDNTDFTLVVNDNCPTGDNSGNSQDGKCAAPVTNRAPSANADTYSNATEDTQLTVSAANGVLFNDTDPDANTTLRAVLVSGPSNAAANGFTLNANGSFSYTPAADFNGQDSFTYKANDGTADSTAATVTINVGSVNDAPSFTKGANETVPEDAGAQTVAGWATNISAGPNESQAVDFLVSTNNDTLFSEAPSVSANGALTYTPADDANGTATVTVTAHDSGGTANGGADTSAAQTFTITVTAVNDAPVATNDPLTTDEDTAGNGNVLTNDSDVDNANASLTAALVSGPSHGTLNLNANGSYTYTPDANYNGSDSFTYKASDGSLDSNTATVSITVTAVNDAPTAPAQSVTTNEDTGKQITLGANDVDGDALTYSVVSAPTHGTLSGTGANLTYTPAANYNGSDSFTYKANDGTVDSNTATVSITVNAVNDAPSFTKGADQTVLQNSGAKTVAGWASGISAGPADESGQAVDFLVSNTNNSLFTSTGQPAISANGTLSYTLAPNTIGTATVSVRAHDDGGTANGGVDTSAAQTFVIDANYNFSGFRAPVDNGGVFNVAKAGSSIPMKFSLSGYQGLGIIAVGYPKVTQVVCPSGAALDTIEEYAATTTNNGLTYDATADQYNYVWKTQSTYSGKCYQFNMQLIDGTTYSALFKFTK